MHRQVSIDFLPQRIVSLVPSQTELLFHLGLADRIVGVTKFCIHPQEQTKLIAKIGGTKNVNLEAIIKLQPDLIIGNKEENQAEDIEALTRLFPVWMSDIYTLPEAMDMITGIGEITGTQATAKEIAHKIQAQFANLTPLAPSVKAAYFIWQNPFMAVGRQTFIDDMLARCGFENAFGHLSRYPEITKEDLQRANPEVILLSSEPYPFKEKHVAKFAEICPEAIIKVVDGERFSWYGSRLLLSAAYFQELSAEIRASL